MNRPLSWVALLYAAGLLAGEFLPCPLGLLFLISFVLLGAAFLSGRWRPALIWPLLLFAAWTNLACRKAIISPCDLRLLQSNRVEIVTVRARLAETPSQRITLRDGEAAERSLTEVEVTRLTRRDDRQPARGRIIVMTPGILPEEFHAGETAEITGVLAPPRGAKAEGLFDYAAYLGRAGIYYQLRATTNDWRLLSKGSSKPWSDRFIAWAQKTLSRGLPEQDVSLRLLLSMTLGLKNVIEAQGYEPFIQTGTMHIFAISGLHIALIAGILVMLLRAVRIPRPWCGAIALPLIWLYTWATGWQPSAIRSTIMMSVIIGGWALERPTDLLNSLGAAAFIILLWDPQQLFGASFQLSFFVVLSIALLLPPLQRYRDARLRHEPLLPAELVPRWKRWSFTGTRCISDPLATSLAAWLGALPITAYYFHMFSPITLFANLLVVPLSSLALAANLGSIVSALVPGPVCELFNHSAWFWMACIVKVSGWFVSVPKAFIYVKAPALPDFVIYYALLVTVFTGWLFLQKVRRWALLALVLVGCLYLWNWHSARAVSTISLLPLDGGISVFVEGPGSDALLEDTGPPDSFDYQLKPFLAAKGVNRLACLVLSHGDLRHIGGAEPLSGPFHPASICVSPVPQRSAAYKTVVQKFSGTPGLLHNISAGDKLGRWKVLHPQRDDRFSRADDAALVLMAELQGTKVLLLSDLGRQGQEALMQTTTNLAADILVTGLPTNDEPVRDSLLQTVQPRVIIVADSDLPAYERASPKCLERLSRRNVPVLSTRHTGALTVRIAEGTWSIRNVAGTTLAAGSTLTRR